MRRFPRTDAGNGELFAHLYADRVRYDHRRGCWLIWSGQHWRVDDRDEVRLLAKQAARARYKAAGTIGDVDERRREALFAIGSEDRYRLEAMLRAAQHEPPVADPGDAWDADPWLLGAANGVVDLRSGTLRPGHPDDRITLCTDVPFDPGATCPRWERFLGEIFREDATLVDWIQRATGYSLTGVISEQCLFLLHGEGANGKSVLLDILLALGGTYAANTPFATFEQHARASIPNDVAALVGKRIVTAAETNDGTRLNEARLKALTGGDPVTARFLHREFFTFRPVATYWLAVNHRPRVTDDSAGFWRRVRLVPFTRRFEQEDDDRGLREKLHQELPGILAWAVRGALAWQEHGLVPPGVVSQATTAYRDESDPLAAFLADCCQLGAGCAVAAGAVYRAYRAWADEEGHAEREILSFTTFGRRMGERFGRVHRNTGNVYAGVALRDTSISADEAAGGVRGQ